MLTALSVDPETSELLFAHTFWTIVASSHKCEFIP